MVKKEGIAQLPNWLFRAYARLYRKFQLNEFSFKQAKDFFAEEDRTVVSRILLDLRRFGWLDATVSQENRKILVYKLKDPATTFVILINSTD